MAGEGHWKRRYLWLLPALNFDSFLCFLPFFSGKYNFPAFRGQRSISYRSLPRELGSFSPQRHPLSKHMVGQIHLASDNFRYKNVASLGPKKGAIKTNHIALINCFVLGTFKKKKKKKSPTIQLEKDSLRMLQIPF